MGAVDQFIALNRIIAAALASIYMQLPTLAQIDLAWGMYGCIERKMSPPIAACSAGSLNCISIGHGENRQNRARGEC